MLSCVAFIALAQGIPAFTEFPRGISREEHGHIGEQKVDDRRVYLNELDGTRYYWVKSQHGGPYVEKVAARTLLEDFCTSMNVEFKKTAGPQWVFSGTFADQRSVRGTVNTHMSYFHNHTWVKVAGLLELTVTPLPLTPLSSLNLKSLKLCESTDQGLQCSDAQDLSHLGM